MPGVFIAVENDFHALIETIGQPTEEKDDDDDDDGELFLDWARETGNCLFYNHTVL